MALKEYIGLARLTQAFSLLKSKLDGKENTPTVISYDDFMALTPQQQTSGYYLVVGGTPMTNAYGISYQPNKTVGDALDDHAEAISELNADIPQLVGSVVGDGVKTYNQLLGELYTAYVNSGKTFKANSYLELQNGNYVPTTGNGSFISFYVNNAQMSTSQIYIGSSPTFYTMTCTTGRNTISDIGSTVASNGYSIKLYV